MDRRNAVKILGSMMGAGIMLPGHVLARAEALMEQNDEAPKAHFFNKNQRKVVAAFAECVVPRTDTPGAKDAGVPGWIEIIAQDCLDDGDQAQLLQGLDALQEATVAKYAAKFTKLSYAQQVEFLTQVEKDAMKADKPGDLGALVMRLKDFVKYTYAHSKRGATEAFEYILVPGKWDGSMPLKPGQKVWAVD